MATVTHRDIWRANNVEAETSVYWAYGDDDQLLYVGLARDVGERLSQHRREKPWWGGLVAVVRSIRCPSREHARALESAAITAGQPIANINYPGFRRRG